jgi:hypothetical protein
LCTVARELIEEAQELLNQYRKYVSTACTVARKLIEGAQEILNQCRK